MTVEKPDDQVVAPLEWLATAVATDPAVTTAADGSPAVGVPEAARAVTVAALVQAQRRRPVLVVCPTGTEAEHLVDDLGAFIGRGRLAAFPAWETLPFERVSPNVHTMGTRLETLWRLGSDDPPAVVVTSARALIQRLAPGTDSVRPIEITAGARVDIDELCAELARIGYRREPVVEHRG